MRQCATRATGCAENRYPHFHPNRANTVNDGITIRDHPSKCKQCSRHILAAIARCTDAGTTRLLDDVCDLYVLANIEADRAWLLEHGRLSRAQAKDVTAAVNALCRRLRPHAATLVERFGIPEPWLVAPITARPRLAESLAS